MIALEALHELPMPQGHQELLDQLETQVAEGAGKFIDWETAKREVMEAVK